MKYFILTLMLTLGFTGFAAEFSEISKDELAQAIEAKSVVLFDVNGSASYKTGHIPGALDFETKRSDLVACLPSDKSTLIVAYCGGPSCNAWETGAKAVAALGYTNVRHFKGGISGWKTSGAKIESVQ